MTLLYSQEHNLYYRPLADGIGEAVAKRTFLRKKENGEWENWADVAVRTAKGNCSLHETGKRDEQRLKELIAKGALMLSGRQLQHGDENQKNNLQEKYVNCACSLTTHMLFYLALNGCGIGTSYDDELTVVDWNFAPKVICLLSENHPDFKTTTAMSKEKWIENGGHIDHVVHDSREGWAKAVEDYEVLTFNNMQGAMKKEFITDFSEVRPERTPIEGMQGRPASGPNPLIGAFHKVNALIESTKDDPYKPWKIKMHVDHYFGACVMFGGVRRIARAAYKFWKDPQIFDFINIKENGDLWSANNSVAVDQEFWDGCLSGNAKCLMILGKATEAAYYHNSGEPGLLNIDKLVQNNEGLDKYLSGELKIGSSKYTVSDDAQKINKQIFENLLKSKYKHGVNPCVTGNTFVRTSNGFEKVSSLLGKPFKAVINGKEYHSNGFYQTGVKSTLIIKTDKDQVIECTSNHKILTPNEEWKEARFLNVGDQVATGSGTSIISLVEKSEELKPVYDCSVDEVHRFEAIDESCFKIMEDFMINDGIIVHNCFEISLQHNSGFCVLCDVFGYNADSLEEVEEATRHAARETIRLNLMDSVFGDEVKRTNRIGISFVGWHEFAWKFFKLGFRDLIDESKSQHFWDFMNRLSLIAVGEADRYSDELGVVRPHTVLAVKPSGSCAKVWSITEGIHLPAMREYLRWVQFKTTDPLVDEYEAAGYPVIRDLKSYEGSSIVGFPTQPEICKLDMGEKLVTISEATIEEQFKWLHLIEKYWIVGVNEDGTPREDRGNQISATIKFKPEDLTYQDFYKAVLEWQPKIKCASIMPQVDATAYEYQPEEPVSKAYYDALVEHISSKKDEDVDFEHVDCAGGYCPIDFSK